jgi:hypothetical protein
MGAIYSILQKDASRKLLNWAGRGIPQTIHHKAAGRNPAPAFETSFKDYRAVSNWWVADVFVEQTAERPKTREANFKADISDRQTARGKQFLCFLDAPLGQVLMRSLIEGPPEEPQEVIA